MVTPELIAATAEELHALGFHDAAHIGSGRQGMVFSARDSRDDRVAVKVLHDGSAALAGSIEAEFRMLRELTHPNLVAVHDFGRLPDGRHYYSMDWIDGVPVDRAMFLDDAGRIDEQRFAEFLADVSMVLHHVHERTLVHGDIKPDNIIITTDAGGGRMVHLMDFGLAQQRGSSGTVSGTLAYMAPEVLRRERATPASDLYSLGCVAFELLTGEPPHTGGTSLEVVRAHLLQDVDTSVLPVSDVLRGWIAALAARDPAYRFRSALALHREVGTFLGRPVEAATALELAVPMPVIPRSTELAKALELLGQSESASQFLVVTGPPGIGKSQLLRDIRTEIQVRGGQPVCLSFTATDSAFAPVIAALQALPVPADGTPGAEARRVMGSAFPDAFPGMVPEPLAGLDDEGRRIRILHAAVVLLTSADHVTLVADDVDQADAFSLEFLQYLVGHAQANPSVRLFLVVATTGDARFLTEEPTLDTAGTTVISLQPWNAAQVTGVIEAMFGAVISPSLVAVLNRQSRGIPGTLRELLDFCIADGILERTPDGWIVHERDNLAQFLPSNERGFLERRVSQLDAWSRHVLSVLCLAPAAVHISAMAHVLDCRHEGVLAGIAALQAAECAVFDGVHLRPSSDTLRTIVAMPDAGARPLHDRFASWLEVREPVDAEALAHHLYRSSDPSRALPHLLTAADLRRRYDVAGARRLFEQALELCDSREDGERRFDLLETLTEIDDLLGNRTAAQEAIEELLILGAQLGHPRRLARVFRRQAEFHLSGGDFERARKSAEKALGYYRASRDTLGEAWCHQKIGFCDYRLHPGEAVLQHYQQALEKYAAGDAPLDEGNLLIDIGLVHYSVLKRPDEALACFERARERFESLGFVRGVARAVGNAGRQLFQLGRIEEAYACYQQALEMFTRIADRRLIAITCHALGQCETTLGRYTDAIHHLRQGLTIAREVGDLYAREMILESLGEAWFLLGQYAESGAAYVEARELAERTGNSVGVIANDIDTAGVLIEQRQVDEAIRMLKRCEPQLQKVEEINVSCMFLYRLGIAHLGRGERQDIEAAQEALRRLGDMADQHGFLAHQILARSYAGLAALLAGRSSEGLLFSTEAVAMVDGVPHIIGGRQDIYFNHARILRAEKQAQEAKAFIERAHEELMSIAASIQDVHQYRSFLENVRINAEIQREHALLHRSDSPQAANAIRERNLQTLYDVTAKMIAVHDLSALLESIMDSALVAMNGERGLIFLLENDQLALKVSRNVEQETIEDASEISRSILRDVVSGGRPILIADTSKNDDVRMRESVVNFNIHSIICVPMRLKSRIIGTVYVDSRSDAMQALGFSTIDADFLEAFANLASIALENAWMHEQLREENLYLRRETQRQFGFENIIGSSQPMQKLFRDMEVGITSDGSVLISGESGTGKELVARAIHYHGVRKDGKFVAVDCGAVQDTLLESELFGYKRGAFTGAYTDKRGLFEEAHNGTLFLDEISNTSLAFQAKLLRVLQEGEFRRIGDTVTRTVNVRIICATNKDIIEEVRQERFRQDLFYRLNVIPILIPPLRDRIADIPLLIQHFIDRYRTRNTTPVTGASEDVVQALQAQPWKGNVRELENLINRVLPQVQEAVITTRHLPDEYRAPGARPQAQKEDMVITMAGGRRLGTLQEIEREHIAHVLRCTKNKTDAAAILGLKRTTLVEKMKKLGMM